MTPVLDKGYVKLISATFVGDQLPIFLATWNRGRPDPRLLSVPTLTLEIKAPLFVRMFLAESGIIVFDRKGQESSEAYVPTVAEVNASVLAVGEQIQANIAATTEALLMNPKAYAADHCDRFVAQVITPVSLYNEFVAHGSLWQWSDIILAQSLPLPIEAYRNAIDGVMVAEWPAIKSLAKSLKK